MPSRGEANAPAKPPAASPAGIPEATAVQVRPRSSERRTRDFLPPVIRNADRVAHRQSVPALAVEGHAVVERLLVGVAERLVPRGAAVGRAVDTGRLGG